MIDFNKILKEGKEDKKIDPIELYSTLDTKSIVGPLRPIQSTLLTQWYTEHKNDKDLIIKLHTGEGKTLIGLLILQSIINSNEGPCLYVCPNINLIQQVCAEATKFGISYCLVGENNKLPDEFISGEQLLITHGYKLFNGKTIFGINNNSTKVAAIILDDSHACIDIMKSCFSISISRDDETDLYKKIFGLFRDSLAEQGEGSLMDIEHNEYGPFMLVPYWSWCDNKTEVLEILSHNLSCNSIKFAWPLIKDKIHEYCCYISGNKIEISPNITNIEPFGSFSKADRRILMSATTQDDSFFIKGLSFSEKAIKNPLINISQKWYGEKMILIPSLIDENCNRSLISAAFAKISYKNFGAVALVPNTNRAKYYQQFNTIVTTRNTISETIDELRKGDYEKMVVINNRYNGIDLPDESCRILIFDSIPYSKTLSGQYEQNCRPNSEIVNKKLAQLIEQGLGRSVRGEKDFCAILIIGSDLVHFIQSKETKKYFSLQTQKQIEIGLEIAQLGSEEIDINIPTLRPIYSLINQLVDRDSGWKNFYSSKMKEISETTYESSIFNSFEKENEIEKLFNNRKYNSASDKMDEFISKMTDDLEKGWYQQQYARYIYPQSKSKSIELQEKAFDNNKQLLKPLMVKEYIKVAYINQNKLDRIRIYMNGYSNYADLSLQLSLILNNLSFGKKANLFEAALDEIGNLLGFICQRPDNDIRKGPDNLWCGTNNTYLFFECKNQVSEERSEIYKKEAGQMNTHCAWFEQKYGVDTKVQRFLLIPTKKISHDSAFTHDVRIIRKKNLNKFKKSILGFIMELKAYNFSDISNEKLQGFLDLHKLNQGDLYCSYSEKYIQ